MHHHQHHHVPLKGLFGAGDLDPVSAAAVSAAQLAMLDSLRYLPNLAHHNPALIHAGQVEHYQVMPRVGFPIPILGFGGVVRNDGVGSASTCRCRAARCNGGSRWHLQVNAMSQTWQRRLVPVVLNAAGR